MVLSSDFAFYGFKALYMYWLFVSSLINFAYGSGTIEPVSSWPTLEQQTQCENEFDLYHQSTKFLDHKTCIFASITRPFVSPMSQRSLCFDSENLAKILYCNSELKQRLQANCNRRFIECACDHMKEFLFHNTTKELNMTHLKQMLHIRNCGAPDEYAVSRSNVDRQLTRLMNWSKHFNQLEACKRNASWDDDHVTRSVTEEDRVCVFNTKAYTLNTKINRKSDEIIFRTRCVNASQLEIVFACSESFRKHLTSGCQNSTANANFYNCVCSNAKHMHDNYVPDLKAELEAMLSLRDCDSDEVRGSESISRARRNTDNQLTQLWMHDFNIVDADNQTELLLNSTAFSKVEGPLILPERCIFNSTYLNNETMHSQSTCILTTNLYLAFQQYPSLMAPMEFDCQPYQGNKFIDCLCTNINGMYSNDAISWDVKMRFNQIVKAERCDAAGQSNGHVIVDRNRKTKIIEGYEKQRSCEKFNEHITANELYETCPSSFQADVKLVTHNGDFVYTKRCINLQNLPKWFRCNPMLKMQITARCGNETNPNFCKCIGTNIQRNYIILTSPVYVYLMDLMLHATSCHGQL